MFHFPVNPNLSTHIQLSTPYKINEELFLDVEKILPPTGYDDYYVNLLDKVSTVIKQDKTNKLRSLPKIDSMLKWGVVKPGDIIVAKNLDAEAKLLENGNVLVDGKEMSMQSWLKEVFGWSSVQTYVFAVHKESGKTFSQIREEYMNKMAEEASEEA